MSLPNFNSIDTLMLFLGKKKTAQIETLVQQRLADTKGEAWRETVGLAYVKQMFRFEAVLRLLDVEGFINYVELDDFNRLLERQRKPTKPNLIVDN